MNSKIKSILKNSIVRFLLTLDKIDKGSGLPVLEYHRVSPMIRDFDVHSIFPHEFQWQMEWLHKRGYQVVSLDEIVNDMQMGSVSGKKVALTFDDGHKDNIYHAYPILKAFGIRATVFVISEYVGRKGWLDKKGILNDVRLPDCQWWELLDWDELHSMKDAFDIGVHGLTHRSLPSLPELEARAELIQSRDVIEKCLGVKPTFYCYPFGEMSTAAVEYVSSSGYKGACGTEKGLNVSATNPYMLKRNEVGRGLNSSAFELLLSERITSYAKLSSLLHRR